jgi:photosystem II stability/assembly factor-like uncharacterized protein/HSP20 family molecular chaperone IbpA
MKKIYAVIFYTILSVAFLSSCQQQSKNKEFTVKEVKLKKKKKDLNAVHKKGIEHVADYQKEIRKPFGAQKSTYKKGYLVEEYKKAKKQVLFSKSANVIAPIFTERGPANVPGRTRGIAVDPTNANRWYVGTVGGGVWLTEDAGTTWENLTDLQIPNLATSTIVISPTDANTLYVGTGEPFGNLGAIGGSGVFKTTDGGTTWQHLTATLNYGDIGRIIINPNDKNNVLIGTESGIYRTINGGTSWTRVYNSSRTVQDLDADPADFNILYGSVDSVGVVKSTDGGLTWKLVFDKESKNTNHRRFELSVSPVDSRVFLSVFSSSGATVGVNTDFYYSTSKGFFWTTLTTEGTATSANLLTGQGWYDNVIMAHPYDANVFYVGGIAVFKVTISGNNFTSESIASGYDNSKINTYVHVDQHGLYTVLGNNQEFKILLANDGGVYSTSSKQDPGVSQGDWSNTVMGKNSTQFYGAAKQNGQDNYLAGAQDNGSWSSGGNNSSKSKIYSGVSGGDGFEVIWHYNKPGSYITTSQYNNVNRFVNNISVGSSNFTDSNDQDTSPFYSKIANANNNPDAVFAVSTNGVWRSTDFGTTWNLTPITSNFTSNATSSLNVKVSSADPDIIWAGAVMTENGSFTMHVSQDNGQTFTSTNVYDDPTKTHSYNISGMSTSYTEKNRAYLAFSGQGAAKILKTEDLGNTWTDISGFSAGANTGFPDVAVHSILEMPFDKDIIWAGTEIGIFQTENGGANWSLVSDFIPVAVYDMEVVNDQVVMATYGRGIWSATISELNNFTLSQYFAKPNVASRQKALDSNKAIISYNVTTDKVNRVKVFIDDVEKAEVVQDFNTGITYNFETLDLTEGRHTVSVQLFEDSNNRETDKENKNLDIVSYKSPSTFLKITEFTESDVFAFNAGFVIDNLSNNITGNVLNNSGHPYSSRTTYSVVLKQPLTISESNKNFMYEDFAIVEPYTTDLNDLSQFYDYVIIEASTDLSTWKTIDKYDSRRFTEWLAESTKVDVGSIPINDALFKEQTIDLTTKGFSTGETIVLRFSLVSDPFTNSYGWAIRSINKEATASVEEVLAGLKAFTIYPTVSNGNFTIQAKNELGKAKMNIFDIRGREVFKKQVDFSVNEKQSISVNLKAGVYFVNISRENNKTSSRKIIIE